jgi:hypothetical protein
VYILTETFPEESEDTAPHRGATVGQRVADDGTTGLQIEKLSINPRDDSSHEDHIHEFSCQSSIDARQLNRDGGHRNFSDSSSPNSDQLGPATLKETLDGSFLFETQNSKANIRCYHPSPRIMELLWKHYIDNVDILVKILYKPAVEALVMNASKDLGKIDASTEALLVRNIFCQCHDYVNRGVSGDTRRGQKCAASEISILSGAGAGTSGAGDISRRRCFASIDSTHCGPSSLLT